jgi:hypothetical protein
MNRRQLPAVPFRSVCVGLRAAVGVGAGHLRLLRAGEAKTKVLWTRLTSLLTQR